MEEKDKTRICVIGAGIVGGAISEALVPRYPVTATRRSFDKLNGLSEKGVRVTSDNRAAAEDADLVILSVKPAQVVPVLKEIAETVSGKTVVSFAAAISTDILRLAAPKAHFVRAMTNIAVRIHKGFTLFYPEPDFPAERLSLLERILMELGEIQQVDEQYLDVLTAMSGSGPVSNSTSRPSASLPALSTVRSHRSTEFSPSRSSITGRRARKSRYTSSSNVAIGDASVAPASASAARWAALAASIQPVSTTTSAGSVSSGSAASQRTLSSVILGRVVVDAR